MPNGILTPDDIVYRLRSAVSPVISPDGSRIVFALTAMDRESSKPRSHLWTMTADGDELTQLTTVGTTNTNPVWSSDSRTIAFVSHGDSGEQFSIRIISISGGESRIAAQHDRSPGGLAWSPDGATLAYSVGVDFAPQPNDGKKSPPSPRVVQSLEYKEDLRGVQNRIRSQIFLLDIARAESTPRQLTSVERDHADPQWSPTGDRLAVKVVESAISFQKLGIIDVETGDTRLLEESGWNLGSFVWTPDGESIVFDGGPDGIMQSEWFRFDIDSGIAHQLTDDLSFAPEGGFAGFMPPATPHWLPDGSALVHGVQAGASGLWTLDPANGAIREIARFTSVQSGLSVDSSARYVVQTYTDPGRIGDVGVYDLTTSTLRVITDLNCSIFDEAPLGRTEHITAESLGEAIDAWVTYPPTFDLERTYPVVLQVHGGPYSYFGYTFDAEAQLLAAAGMIVVSSNPRGSTSYGRRFASMVNRDSGGADWSDVQSALDAVLSEPYADAERTGIMGYSYGGYMTAWAIGQTDRFVAAVCGAPVFDLDSFYGTSDIAYILSPILWGGSPADQRDLLRKQSPSTHIFNASTPTLILCGESDVRCPISQSEQMFAALHTNGVEVEFIRYPNSNHTLTWTGEPSYKVDYYTRAQNWLRKHFGLGNDLDSGVAEQRQA